MVPNLISLLQVPWHFPSPKQSVCWAFQCICYPLMMNCSAGGISRLQIKAPILRAGGIWGQKEMHPNHPVPKKSQPKSRLTIQYVTQDRHFHLLATIWPPSAPCHRKNAPHFYLENQGISGVNFPISNPWDHYFLGKTIASPLQKGEVEGKKQKLIEGLPHGEDISRDCWRRKKKTMTRQ